jgi:hypothetical protein
MVDVQTSEVDAKLALVKTWDHDILDDDKYSKGQRILMREFLWKNEKFNRVGWLKVKNPYLFHGDNSRIVALREIKFGVLKDHGYTYKFYLKHYFV